MKPLKAQRNDIFLDEIVETLRSIPKQRLRIVRDIVGALAEPGALERGKAIKKKAAAQSLLKTPFCGMWEGRSDITNGRSYAESLRKRLERVATEPRVFIDTDILIDIARKHARGLDFWRRAEARSTMTCSVITVLELMTGCRNLRE